MRKKSLRKLLIHTSGLMWDRNAEDQVAVLGELLQTLGRRARQAKLIEKFEVILDLKCRSI